jgi:ABC-2 type transport system permease protein
VTAAEIPLATPVSAPLSTQVGFLARRSFLRVLRQPGQFVFPMIFPILLLIINSAGLSRADELPGFPGATYADFWMANTFIFGAVNLATIAGSNMAVDIEDGFLNRLSLTPLSRAALLTGHLGGIVGVALVNGVVYLLVGLVLGVEPDSGPLGVPVILLLAALTALFFGGFGTYLALRLGSAEAVEGMFPLFFVMLFLSSSNFPRSLMTVGWFKTLATINPVSYVIEAIRSLFVAGWDSTALLRGFAVIVPLAVLTVALSAAAARTRLERRA